MTVNAKWLVKEEMNMNYNNNSSPLWDTLNYLQDSPTMETSLVVKSHFKATESI